MPESIMLDPSLLLSFKTQPLLTEARRRGELEGMVLPASFVRALTDDRATRAASYFGKRRELSALLPLVRNSFGDFPTFQSSGPAILLETDLKKVLVDGQRRRLSSEPRALRGQERFERQLRGAVRSQVVYEILSEEWEFLQSRSWIVSKIRKPFNVFIKAGGVAIEWSHEHFDIAAAKTL